LNEAEDIIRDYISLGNSIKLALGVVEKSDKLNENERGVIHVSTTLIQGYNTILAKACNLDLSRIPEPCRETIESLMKSMKMNNMGINSKTFKQFVETLKTYGFRVADDDVPSAEPPIPPLAKLSVKEVTLAGEPNRAFNEFRIVAKVSWRVDTIDKAIKRLSDAKIMCKKEGITFISCNICDNEAEVYMSFSTHAAID